MRTLIAGAGAVGGYFGYVLTRAGWPVTLLARGPAADAMEAHGLRVCHGESAPDTVRPNIVRALTPRAGAVPFALILVTVKAPDLPALIPTLGPVLAADGLVLPLQNGLEPDAPLAAAVGPTRLVRALALINAETEAPGVVRALAGGAVVLDGGAAAGSTRVAALGAALTDAGLPARVSRDFELARWRKAIWNAAFNPVTALARVRLDRIVGDPALLGVCRAALREGLAVARAAGVALDDAAVEQSIAASTALGAGGTSMLYDALHDRPNEAEAVVGRLVAIARTHGIATPTLDALFALARARGVPVGPRD